MSFCKHFPYCICFLFIWLLFLLLQRNLSLMSSYLLIFAFVALVFGVISKIIAETKSEMDPSGSIPHSWGSEAQLHAFPFPCAL